MGEIVLWIVRYMLGTWATVETRLSWRGRLGTMALCVVCGWRGTPQALPLSSLRTPEMQLML
ncbi:unnamed protein product [Coregonus sp. 'balchen']|nr:unnamed protein product [Coregonus sp. 'balchen']